MAVDYAQAQIERFSNRLRKFVKSFYVARVLPYVDGPAIDLGCGPGHILERLPKGSMGVEVNPFLVAHLRKGGLSVIQAEASGSGFDLELLPRCEFKALVLSHVLEHFADADKVLRKLLQDCSQLGISRVIVVVPGEVGFRSDPTHKTFVDFAYLSEMGMLTCAGFKLSHYSYFPGNWALLGKFFIYHEMMLVWEVVA